MRAFSLKCLVAAMAVFSFQWISVAQPCASEVETTFEVSPKKVEINSFYHGTALKLTGTVPAGSEVAVILLGEKIEHTLQRKDRVGPLWMNVDTVMVEGAPEMYYLATSTEKQEELASLDVLTEYSIGYKALQESITIKQGKSGASDSLFPEFIKLKEHMGLYKIIPSSIKLDSAGEDRAHFVFSLPIPPLAPPGEYEIQMCCFKDGWLLAIESSELVVEKVGMPQKLSSLAFDHAALYGILAIVAAIAAGILMGLVFGKKEQGGH